MVTRMEEMMPARTTKANLEFLLATVVVFVSDVVLAAAATAAFSFGEVKVDCEERDGCF